MNDCRERNQKIFQMALEGVSHTKIARAFRLSPSRIWLAVRAIKKQNALAERRRNLVEEIRRVDDLDKPWEVKDLDDALRALTADPSARENEAPCAPNAPEAVSSVPGSWARAFLPGCRTT